MVGGVGVLGGGGHISFSKKMFVFQLHKNAKKGIFNLFLTLWWVAGAGDEGNTTKF